MEESNYIIIDSLSQITYTENMVLEKVFAQGSVNLRDVGPADSITSYGLLVNVLVQNAFVFGGVISFILLIFGAFQVIVAAGDPKKLEKARNIISGSIVGLIVVLGSFWIVQIIETITGLEILTPGV